MQLDRGNGWRENERERERGEYNGSVDRVAASRILIDVSGLSLQLFRRSFVASNFHSLTIRFSPQESLVEVSFLVNCYPTVVLPFHQTHVLSSFLAPSMQQIFLRYCVSQRDFFSANFPFSTLSAFTEQRKRGNDNIDRSKDGNLVDFYVDGIFFID